VVTVSLESLAVGVDSMVKEVVALVLMVLGDIVSLALGLSLLLFFAVLAGARDQDTKFFLA
jgi:hypothetical protein